jgi:creatinine amidohydrolase
MTSFLGSQDQTWFGSLRATGGSSPRVAVFPLAADWEKAREHAGLQTSNHEDMHAGELETSILLATYPHVIRPGNETADWAADERPHLLTLGMAGYTKSGVIGRPSLGTKPESTDGFRDSGASQGRRCPLTRENGSC